MDVMESPLHILIDNIIYSVYGVYAVAMHENVHTCVSCMCSHSVCIT